MENQVTSIEQSRRLLELGVPAEKASMEWKTCRIKGYDYDWTLEIAYKGGRCVGYNNTSLQIIPAFTVADLLGMLPFEIDTYCGICYLQIKKLYTDRNYSEWGVYYKNDEGFTPFESITSYGIIEALFSMVEKIICYGGCCELNL